MVRHSVVLTTFWHYIFFDNANGIQR